MHNLAGRAGSRPTKVAVIIGALDVGGSESDLVRALPLLDPVEFDVTVLEFSHEGSLGERLQGTPVKVISRRTADEFRAARPDGRFAEMRERWRVACWLLSTLRSLRPDVTHSVLPHSYLYQMATGLFIVPRPRTVMSRRSLNFYRESQRFISQTERLVLHRFVDIAVGNSRCILEELADEGVAARKLRLVHNGIDVEYYTVDLEYRQAARNRLEIADSTLTILSVGNLHEYKGHAELVEACALASEDLGEWILLIAGRDEQGNRASCERLAERLGVSDRVRFLGEVADVREVLAAADIFCQPSHHEGVPNSIIEAMASGLPVIASDVGGIPEAVVDDGRSRTGWLVPPMNVEALAAALRTAAADRDGMARMGQAARDRASREFSVGRTAAAYAAIYRELES